jgi:hypothetical protein
MQDLDEGTWCIECDHRGDYICRDEGFRISMVEVYLTEKTAKIICDALNEGELVL